MISQRIQQFDAYLRFQCRRSSHTVDAYIRDTHQFVALTGLTDLNHVSDTVIHAYLEALHNRAYSHTSIYRKRVALSQFWRFLIQANHVDKNPWAPIRRPKPHRHIPSHLEESRVMELLHNYPESTVMDKRNKAILAVLLCSGIRVSELTTLTRSAIDSHNAICRIHGKGNKTRMALLGPRAMRHIQDYLNHAANEWPLPRHDYVFYAKSGTPLTVRSIQRIVKKANQFHSADSVITPHGCRHTCANLLISNGAPMRDVQEFLGHSSILSTERYTHIPNKHLTETFLRHISPPASSE